MKKNDFSQINSIFFIGIAGTGMSALAQYAAGIGKKVAGSDRYFSNENPTKIQLQLRNEGIECFPQDGSGITGKINLVVISTAVEDTNIELQKAKQLGIKVIKRSELLTILCGTKKTIAVGGTSGKSTTTAMIFDILEYAGLEPSIISGAGLVRLQEAGKIGNAWVGKGEWLVIEADESDGSIVNYHPEIGLLLNIDKDHKEITELEQLFEIFKKHSKKFIVNASHPLASAFSANTLFNFSSNEAVEAGYTCTGYVQQAFISHFFINHVPFHLQSLGFHNVENALAATTVAAQCDVPINICAKALEHYKGIYRRNQIIGKVGNVWLIDDFAHNPAKVAAAIRGVQPISNKVIAWFQPHGYGPTRFLRADFVEEIHKALRPNDEIWMSEIYYAGGTATKDISAKDLIIDLQQKGSNAFFVENRKQLVDQLQLEKDENYTLLLMGARDPSLEDFAQEVYTALKNK